MNPRKSLNKGGIDHFINPKNRQPFTSPMVWTYEDGWHAKRESEYPEIERLNAGPDFANVILMSFESALSNGGWRPEVFIRWFERHVGVMQVELVQAIETRLYPVITKSSGIKMSEKNYQLWFRFEQFLRRYLYDL